MVVNEGIILQDQLCVGGYVEEQLVRPLCGSDALFSHQSDAPAAPGLSRVRVNPLKSSVGRQVFLQLTVACVFRVASKDGGQPADLFLNFQSILKFSGWLGCFMTSGFPY